jgi:Ca2+-binding EF-hand superfamily protein
MFETNVRFMGSLTEKLKWIFSLYDMNGDNFISRREMFEITTVSVQMD